MAFYRKTMQQQDSVFTHFSVNMKITFYVEY